MAVSLAGAQLSTFSGSGSSLTVSIPAGGTEDVVVLIAHASGDFGDPEVLRPSGWTSLGGLVDISGGDLSDTAYAFYKVFTSSGATTQAVTTAGPIETTFGDEWQVLALRYTGVDTAGPIPEIATPTLNTGAGSTVPHGSVTVGSGNWSALATYNASGSSRTPPAGWTEDYDTGHFSSSHREYATGAATGSVSTTSSPLNRVGWAWEVAAKASATIATNHLGPTSTKHTPTAVTPGSVSVATNLLASGSRHGPGVALLIGANHRASAAVVNQPAIVGGDSTVVIGATVGPTALAYQPSVQASSVAIGNNVIATTTLYQPGVFRGDGIANNHLGPTSQVVPPGIVPGPVSITPSLPGPSLAVLWDDGSPVLWDDGSPAQWDASGAVLATLFTPGISTDSHVSVNHIATTVVYEPTTVAYVPLSHLGPTSSVHAQLIGSFVVLAEPDEVVWGASGGFSARVDFLDPSGHTIASTADPQSRIVLVSGSVNEDRTQAVTRECSLRLLLVPDEAGELHPLNPSKPGDPLDPRTGGAVAVFAGPIRPSGTPDHEKLGVFKITDVHAASTGTGESLDLRGLSLEHEIRAAGFWVPTVVLEGTRAVDAIVALAVEAIPDIDVTSESSAVTVPGELSWGDSDDRLTAVNDLAASVAMVARFDREGVYRVTTAVQFGDEPDQSPRWTLSEGDLATVRDVSRDISDAELFNGVIVVGEPLNNDSDPVRAEVWDTRPASPVYYDPDNPGRSLIGPRPKKIVSPLVTTVQQAAAMAAAELAKALAFADRISVTMAANPEIEAEDVVRVVRSTMGVDALYRVQSVTHDLLGAASEAVCVAL